MARRPAGLPQGSRISDYISLGVIAKTFPAERIEAVLAATGKASVRRRELPAQVVVYYVIALALYMQSSYREVLRCLLEGLQWLSAPGTKIKVASNAAISQARSRLGAAVLRQLHDECVQPIATLATRMGAYAVSEISLAEEVVGHLRKEMLCLADRSFFSYPLWNQARASGADLLWRGRKNLILACEQRLPDGSYLSRIYPSQRERRQHSQGVVVRVIEYRLQGVPGAEPFYRLLTTILDPEQAPAAELAALYPERWEIETALDELKTHLRGARIVLRSKTPQLVEQEFYGLLLAHFAIRGLMHEAALKADEDPDRLSFLHAVRVVRRKLPRFVAVPPSAQKSVP